MLHATRFSSIILSTVLAVVIGAPGIAAAPGKSPSEGKSQSTAEVSRDAHPANADQFDAMQADAKKMRVILNQMRTNLAFVQNTQTPLKHQFELEIEMWQTQLDQMDRRIQQMQHRDDGTPSKK
jgi:hypothetical protein